MTSINLSSKVKVKLTEFGYKIWLSQADSFIVYGNEVYQRGLKKLSSEIDANGYLTTTFANLMNIFGPSFYREPPFENMTIFVNDENEEISKKQSYNLKNQIGNQLK